MAPNKKSASSASSSTTSSTSSSSGSDSSTDSTDSSSSSASVKDPKIEKTAQQPRRKSQEVPKTKVIEKKITSSDDDAKKKAASVQKKTHAKVPMTGAKVPPSVIKEMQNPLPKGTVRPSLGMKAAAQQKHKNKITPVKKTTSSTSDSEEEKKPIPVPIKKVTNPQPQKRRGRPPKNPPPTKVPTASSSSTESTDSEDTGSESTGDSSSAAKDLKKDTTNKKDSKKQTRSSNIRRSKHLLGKTETDSDSDIRRSFSRSPKRLNKFAKKDVKPVIKVEPPEKRRCPLEACDSMGHLGGQHDRHFTIEACPMYHNMTANDTRSLAAERKKRDEERKKALETLDRSRKMLTPEQKIYGQKVRDARAKFKSPTPSSKDTIKADPDSEREPNLKNIVPDYDYQLFRQAQSAASESIENELKALPASRGTKYITMGKNCMVVWYQSPYPEDVARLPKLYLCEFCLRYQKCAIGMKRHAAKCLWRHPPGDEIYRRGKLGVWQIDGKRQKQYCQHLCLLAKFFLDHKTLYYDVEPFLFYVMTIADADGCHTIGYFSKEKNSFLNYNVSCILTLPPYQRKGYGRLLIDFSYLLTRVEGKIGSPEKPLSDLGLISYRSYWKDVLLNYLCSRSGNTLSIKDISQEMAINSYDIVSTLQALGMMKYWKGKHIILKKQDVLEEYSERLERRGNFPKIDQACLRWVPFVPPQPSTPS